MRALIVVPYFYPRIGGLENYAYQISKRLCSDFDVEITVICSKWERQRGTVTQYNQGLTVHILPWIFKVSSTPISPFWVREIRRIIKNEEPDVINGHIPVPYIADLTARIARRKGIPFILTYHNDLVGHNPIIQELSRVYYSVLGYKTLSIATKIIATSPLYVEQSPYLRKYQDKIDIVPPGVDTKRFCFEQKGDSHEGQKIMGDGPSVLFVGQLHKESRHKGLEYLIMAMGIIHNEVENLKLYVVGEGDYRSHYEKLVHRLGISERVIFLGRVEDQILPAIYRESSLVVLPSYNMSEGFGMVLLEALACGRPVVGSAVGGIPYTIRDAETGLLVPPKDPEALGKAILRILQDRNLRTRVTQTGPQRVRREHNWDALAERTHKIYESVLT